MELTKAIKKYLEQELYDYEKNIKQLELLREEIIDSSPNVELRYA